MKIVVLQRAGDCLGEVEGNRQLRAQRGLKARRINPRCPWLCLREEDVGRR